MMILSISYCAGLAIGAVSLFLADWTPEMITVLIGAVSSLIAALVAGVIAVINATTKAKIDAHRALSQMNNEKLDEIHVEMIRNTAATVQAESAVKASVDQTKVRVEELGRSMSDVAGHIGATGPAGPAGEKGDKGEKGDRGNGQH